MTRRFPGFGAGCIAVLVCIVGIPYAGYAIVQLIVQLAGVPKSDRWLEGLALLGILAVLIGFFAGKDWVGAGSGFVVFLYHVVALPLALGAIVQLAGVTKSDRWFAVVGVWGILAVLIGFSAGKDWVRRREQEAVQRRRDRKAFEIREQLSSGRANPYTLYLRPFSSTGRVRIPLRSVVLKRGVMAGPGTVYDPELGRTSRHKRYVTFGDLETVLAEMVEPEAPLIALGVRAEQIGAGRIESDDDHWYREFELLATHARALLVLPSLHEGTRVELQRILDDAALLRKTIFIVPPSDTVLGPGAGPHLAIGAAKGPVGALDMRRSAIDALAQLVRGAPLERLKGDKLGAVLQLAPNGRVTSYDALQQVSSFSLNPFSVGSNLHLDRAHLRRTIAHLMERIRASPSNDEARSASAAP